MDLWAIFLRRNGSCAVFDKRLEAEDEYEALEAIGEEPVFHGSWYVRCLHHEDCRTNYELSVACGRSRAEKSIREDVADVHRNHIRRSA